MSAEQHCHTCRFSRMEIIVDEGEPVMRCYRFPPILVIDPIDGDILSLRPDAEDWCGEWQEGRPVDQR